ncbi:MULTISPECIES: M20 peptidase aminoacylase family protein [Bacillus]|uniref:M20 peptidase aminoacylase family protein n=1 Tax=Bacillus TaxID=1386 RepID=UPI001582F2A6|nr:M20 peptidase aminoacylase family protein [Bacillus glycinifermentans]MBU8785949.1 amidohydrolase [Bacillus glycinifermentans]NUJ15515.1 amidohydrolase [Bacillus glycinifermentans]
MALTDSIKQKMISIFEHLHNHPEVSWKEYETTAFLKKQLEENGCRTQTFADCTGVIGEIGEGSPVVAVRADIDALWQEVDGTFQANHSCGHDSHMTMALGTLMTLKEQTELPKGTIRFIFQPAEEKGGGALKMIEKGILDDVDYLYGVHVRPVQETLNGRCAPAILHGASCHIEGTVIGEEAHGARPHLGKNSIEIAATLVHKLAHIHIDPMTPHTVKMTKLQAGGESSNIIPGKASFSLDLRAQTNEAMEVLERETETACQAVADSFGATIELHKEDSLPAAVKNEAAIAIMAEAISSVIGAGNLDKPLVTTGGEDFHYYSVKRPHLKATMLGLGCCLTPGLHHPMMTFDRDAMFTGADILAEAVLKTFEKIGNEMEVSIG